MIRKTRGRPPGPALLFVEDLIRLDATDHLVKSRGCEDMGATVTTWALKSAASETSAARTFVVHITRTDQPFGGTRRWWLCPGCQRRCGVLFLVDLNGPLGCRRCLGARYVRDYPGRARWRQFRECLLNVMGGWANDPDHRQIDVLLARRRRGVRRGRRVGQRALRLLVRTTRALGSTGAILNSYQANRADT